MCLIAHSRFYRRRSSCRSIRTSLALVLSLVALCGAQIPTPNITSGQLYTIFYNEPLELWTSAAPCAGRVLTYTRDAAAVFFRQPGPAFPLVVWRIQAVKGRPGQFTLEAVNRTVGVSRLAYPTNCTKGPPSNVFLASPGTKGVEFRWKVYWNETNLYAPASWVLQQAGRRCAGAPKEIAGPDAVASGRSCNPPYQGVRLWKNPTGNRTNGMTWGLQPFTGYPATLMGTRVAIGMSYLDSSHPLRVRSDDFGRAVAMRGNVLAVGQKDGAYAFTRRAEDAWGVWQRHTLRRPKNSGVYFGASVAVGSGYVVVGSKGYSPKNTKPFIYINNKEMAQAYVYLSKDWKKVPYALPKPSIASADFGSTVAAYGDTIAVTDPSAGNVFIYTQMNGLWSGPYPLLPKSIVGCCFNVAVAKDTLVTEDGSNVVVFARKNGDWKSQGVLGGRLHWWTSLQLSESGNTLAIWSDVYTRALNGTWTLLQHVETNNTNNGTGTGGARAGTVVLSDNFRAVIALSDDLLIEGINILADEPDNWLSKANAWVRESAEGLYVKKAPLEVLYPGDMSVGSGFFGSTAAVSGDFIAVVEPGTVGNQYGPARMGSVYLWSKRLL